MNAYTFFEYRAKLISTPHAEEQGEPVHCLVKLDLGARCGASREVLEQEVGDLVLFSVNPGPHRRISHSSIDEVNEKRFLELGPSRNCNQIGRAEVYFYPS